MKLKKKIKKLLLVFSLILTLSISVFGFSASALQEVWFACDKPVVTDNSGYVEVSSSQGSFVFVLYTAEYESPSFSVFTDENGYLYFKATTYENGVTRDVPCYSYYLTQDGKAFATPYWSDSVVSYYRVYNISKINGYNVDCSLVSALEPSNPYTFLYSSEVVINDTLKAILGVLAADQGSSSQIIDSINQNTDKIQNGWQQEDEIDTSTTDEYAKQDAALQGATEQGRSQAIGVFDSFGSLFQGSGHLSKGLLSVSAIFTEFLKVGWLKNLLEFSLALGIFAFVIGTGSEIFKSSHENYEDNKYDKLSKSIGSYDERWLM